jgi:hypothetical protein
MAKPIRATPTLRGEDARRVNREWTKECRNPSPSRVKFIKEMDRKKDFYLKFINDN